MEKNTKSSNQLFLSTGQMTFLKDKKKKVVILIFWAKNDIAIILSSQTQIGWLKKARVIQ